MHLRVFAERAWSLALLSSSGQFRCSSSFWKARAWRRERAKGSRSRDVREEKGTAGKTTRCAHICHAKSKKAKLDAADDVKNIPSQELQ